MRCQVLLAKDSTLQFGNQNFAPTDIEVWNEATAYRTALTTAKKRDLSKTNGKPASTPTSFKAKLSEIISGRNQQPQQQQQQGPKIVRRKQQVGKNQSGTCESGKPCSKDKSTEESPESENKTRHKSSNSNANQNQSSNDEDEQNDYEGAEKETEGNHNSSQDNLVESSLPPMDQKQKKLSELQRMKANCKSEDIQKLKSKCETLVRDCIGSLLVKLSQEDFKNMEGEWGNDFN